MLVGPPAADYTINCADVTTIDSSGFGMFLLLRDHAQGRPIVIRNIPENLRGLIERMNFQLIFKVE